MLPVRFELGPDDPRAGTLTTGLPFLDTNDYTDSISPPPSTQHGTYISKCLEILNLPPLHTTKHLYLEMSRDTLAKNEPRKAPIYVKELVIIYLKFIAYTFLKLYLGHFRGVS